MKNIGSMLRRLELNDLNFILGSIGYRIVFEIVFVKIVYPIYFYDSLDLYCNVFYYLLGWMLTILGSAWMSKELKNKTMQSNIMALLFFMSFLPSITLAGIIRTTFFWEFLVYCFVFCLAYIIIPDFKIKRPQKNYLAIVLGYMMLIFSIAIIYIWFVYADHRLSLVIDQIYVARAEATTNDLSLCLKYIYVIAKNILPLVIVYYLYQKKYWMMIWSSILQYLIFVYDGSKTTVVALVLSLISYFIFFKIKNAERYYPLFFAGGTFVGLMEYILIHHTVIIHYFIRRVLMGPSIIHYYYFDFFSDHKPDFFLGTILRRFGFVSDYNTLGIPRTIGQLYMHNVDNSVNNGLFSDAISNMGYIGFLIMPVMVMIVIKILQTVSRDLPIYIPVSCCFMVVFTIMSNSFFSFFITHGFLFFIIILYLWPIEKEKELCVESQDI